MDQRSAKLFGVIVPILVIFCSLNFILTDTFYGLNPSNLENSTELNSQVMGFLRGQSELPSAFNQREIDHMYDVKGVIDGFNKIALLLFLVEAFLLYIIFKNKEYSALKYSGISSLFLSILLLICSVLFDMAFTSFHRLFFASGSWIFNPNDLIVNIYPKIFFFQSLIFIFLSLLLLGSLSYLSYLFLMSENRKFNKQ